MHVHSRRAYTGGRGTSRLSSPQDSDLHGHAMRAWAGCPRPAEGLLRQAQIYDFVITCFGVVTATRSLENPGAAFSRTYQADREEICEAGNILCGGVSRAPGTGPFVCGQNEAETDKGQGLGEGLRHLGALVGLHQDTCPQLPEQNSHRPRASDAEPAAQGAPLNEIGRPADC